MKYKSISTIAFAFGLAVPVAALAQTDIPVSSYPADNTSVIQRLQAQERMDEFKAKFWSQEPVTQQDYYVQEKQDRQLIANISAGEPVSPDELAQALKRIDTPY